MLLPTFCLFVLLSLILFGGSSSYGTNRKSKSLNSWTSSSDTKEGTRDLVEEHGNENIAEKNVRIERDGYFKKKKFKRRKLKKQLKTKHQTKDDLNQIHPLLEVKAPLDHYTLIDLLNTGVRKPKHQAFNTKNELKSSVNDEIGSYTNKTSQRGKNNIIDLTVSPKSIQEDNQQSISKTNLQSPSPGQSEIPPKPKPSKDVSPITRTQTTIHQHDNPNSTSNTYLQSSSPGSSETIPKTTSTTDLSPITRTRITTHQHDNRHLSTRTNLQSLTSGPSENLIEPTSSRNATLITPAETTQKQIDEAPNTDNVIKPFYSNVPAVGEHIHNNVPVLTGHKSLQRSNSSTNQIGSKLGAAVSKNCNNSLDIHTCMSSFSLRGLFSFRNVTTVNPRKGQEAEVEALKTRQVIMLTNMFNKSLSQTWKLLIPHPRLETALKSQTKSEGVFETEKEEETSRISSASPQQLLTKQKKKKANVYTKSDHRPSAIGIGSVGALVLVTIVVGIIILDSRSLYRDIRRLKRSLYNLCKPVYKHKLTISKRNQIEKWAYVIHERHV